MLKSSTRKRASRHVPDTNSEKNNVIDDSECNDNDDNYDDDIDNNDNRSRSPLGANTRVVLIKCTLA